MNWTEINIFKGIDLNDSFVLNWKSENGELLFNLEASFWPESDYYQTPRNDEYTCYRKAALIFSGTQSVVGLAPINSVRPTIDPDGSVDYGNIEALIKTDHGFELAGEFGNVKILGGELRFEVYT